MELARMHLLIFSLFFFQYAAAQYPKSDQSPCITPCLLNVTESICPKTTGNYYYEHHCLCKPSHAQEVKTRLLNCMRRQNCSKQDFKKAKIGLKAACAPPQASGLSSGAKAGIGVGVAIGVVAIIGVIGYLIFARRRKQRQTSPEAQPPQESVDRNNSSVEIKAELEETGFRHEVDGHGVYQEQPPAFAHEKESLPLSELDSPDDQSYRHIAGLSQVHELPAAPDLEATQVYPQEKVQSADATEEAK